MSEEKETLSVVDEAADIYANAMNEFAASFPFDQVLIRAISKRLPYSTKKVFGLLATDKHLRVYCNECEEFETYISRADINDWINVPCPKCGAIMNNGGDALALYGMLLIEASGKFTNKLPVHVQPDSREVADAAAEGGIAGAVDAIMGIAKCPPRWYEVEPTCPKCANGEGPHNPLVEEQS